MAARHVEMSARIGAMIVVSAAASGADPSALERATGFAAASAADPDARMSIAVETALWDEAERLTGDVDLGLHTAERLQPGAFDVIDYAIRTAPTMRVAMERLARYNRLEHDVAVFTLIDRGAITRVEHGFVGTAAIQHRHSAEFTMACQVVFAAQMTGTAMRPLAIDFKHAAPASRAEHERIFGVAPRFAAPINAIEWDRALLERDNPTADPLLGRTILRHAEALLAARPAPAASHAERVRHLLVTTLGEGSPTLASVARTLKMSERSLQRRLTGDGVTFDALLDEVRHQLAMRYLAEPTLAIAEVAYLLGYSEPSAFHRAFRRWTGTTPSDARHA